jgi:hypothetical protein
MAWEAQGARCDALRATHHHSAHALFLPSSPLGIADGPSPESFEDGLSVAGVQPVERRAGLEERRMLDEVKRLWPELDWISDADMKEKVTSTWVRAFELSPLTPANLERIPFTLLVPDCSPPD